MTISRGSFARIAFALLLAAGSWAALAQTNRSVSHPAAGLSAATIDQITALLEEKASRTPAQQKMDSQLLQAVRESRGERMAPALSLSRITVVRGRTGNALVDIDVTSREAVDSLIPKIQALGGTIVYPSREYLTVRAEVPLSDAEAIAGYPETKFIQQARLGEPGATPAAAGPVAPYKPSATPVPSAAAVARRANLGRQLVTALGRPKAKTLAGTVDSEGDRAHRADDVRNAYGFDGTGVRIAVLSDSYNRFGQAASDVATGNLPGPGNPYGRTTPVTVLNDVPYGEDEGRAMLQIVHDLAPGAQLFFASADVSEAAFAANILALRNTYHCDIIVDDFTYFDEPVFQDGIVAQAVSTVTADGAMFFTNAGNEGSVAKGTGAYYEGDFSDAGSPAFVYPGGAKAGTIHNFGTVGSPVNGDIITRPAQWAYTLKWADPLGAATDDYDLFYVNSSGTVIAQSTNIQNGTQNPYEQIIHHSLTAGDRLVVFKSSSAAALPFSLDALRGRLTLSTTGQIFGHHAVPGAISVAATPAHLPAGPGYPVGPYPGVFSSSNQVENFESDGPRRLFFNPDGTQITPGNILFATNGGAVRNVPDVTAADGVATTFDQNSGFNPFYGTSAAAPHAGAIAALLKSANPALTPAQIRTILTSTAVDIESSGWDNISGAGILQAYQAMQAVGPTPFANVGLGTVTTMEGAFSNSNGVIDPGELGSLAVQLTNPSTVDATSVTATLASTTPGVTITQATASYGTITGGGNATNSGTPFQFGVSSSVACGTVLNFYLKVSFTGGPSPQTLWFTVQTGTEQGAVISSTLGSTPPTGTNFTSTSGTQTGVVGWNYVTSSCAVPKSNPGLFSATGSRQYDAYTFTNTTGATRCATVTLNIGNESLVDTTTYGNAGFVPATPNVNYLADGGSAEYTNTYSFEVAAGDHFTTVVSDDTAGAPSNAPYTLNVSYHGCSAPPSCAPFVSGSPSLPSGTLGTPYSTQLSVSGGSGSTLFSLPSPPLPAPPMPGGLTLSPDGTLSGTPTQAGTLMPILVQVTDAAGCPAPTLLPYNITIAGTSPASISAFAGTPQSTAPTTTFATVLKAKVVDGSNNPLPGVAVQFVAPPTGAAGTFSGASNLVNVVTDANGIATAPPFTANSTAGSYSVGALAFGNSPLAPAFFSMTNDCSATAVVTSSADSGAGTLRDVINSPCVGQTVTFDPSVTSISLATELLIQKAITINGPGADHLTIHGNGAGWRVFEIGAPGATITITGMTIRDGRPYPTSAPGGGGGIYLGAGTLDLSNCVVTNNDASLAGPPFGGGIENMGGVINVDHCAIVNNVAAGGGGVSNESNLASTITNSTIAGNTAGSSGSGGGIQNSHPLLSLTNVTLAGNSAKSGGNVSAPTALTIADSIVASGTLLGSGGSGPDVNGSLTANYSLISDTSATTLSGSNDITGVTASLLPLGNRGGSSPTMLPAPDSPAIDAGDPAITTGTDQRGLPRVSGTHVDMGAVETNYSLSATSGDAQSTAINTSFAQPLEATLTESSSPVSGVNVQFTAPGSGASALFSASATATVATDANGIATSPTPVANGTSGSYNVSAGVPNATTLSSINFGLTNVPTVPLTIADAFGTSPLVFGQTTSLTFTITNANALSVAGAGFSDSLPAGLVVATPNGLTSTCGGSTTAAAGSGSVSLTGGTLTSTSHCTIGLNVLAVGLGTHNNTTSAITSTNVGTGAASNTASVVVNQAGILLTVTPLQPPFVHGRPATLSAHLSVVSPGSGTPTGTVTFMDGSNVLGSAPVSTSAISNPRLSALATHPATVNAAGDATLTLSTLSLGSHSITASYSGDADFGGTTSAATSVQVVADIPTTDRKTLLLLALVLTSIALWSANRAH